MMVQYVRKCAIDRGHELPPSQAGTASLRGSHPSYPKQDAPSEPRRIDRPCPGHACNARVTAAWIVFAVTTTRSRPTRPMRPRRPASHPGSLPRASQDACRSTHSGGRHGTDWGKVDGKPGASGTADTQEWRYTPRTTWRGMSEMRCWQAKRTRGPCVQDRPMWSRDLGSWPPTRMSRSNSAS